MTLFGVNYPPNAYIDWFTPAQEAIAVQGGDAYQVPARALTPSQQQALRDRVYLPGCDAGVFGDSMYSWYGRSAASLDAGSAVSSVVYDTASGLVTFTFVVAPNFYPGLRSRFWHYGYEALRDFFYRPLSRVSQLVWTMQLPPGLNVPAIDIKSGFFLECEQGRSLSSVLQWVQMAYGWPLRIVLNAAQSGQTSAGVLRHQLPQLLDAGVKIAIGQMPGINNLNNFTDLLPHEDRIISDNRQFFDALIERGTQVICAEMTPVGAGEARATRQNMLTVIRCNRWLSQYARSKRGIDVVPHYRNFVDVTDADGRALVSRVRAGDAIHPAVKTSVANSKLYGDIIRRIAGPAPLRQPRGLLDSHPTSRITISSATAAGGVITVNSTAHGFQAGGEFRARGATPATANGIFSTLQAPNNNQFTYLASGTPDGAVTGLQISRSRNLLGNPMFLTVNGGGTPGVGITVASGTTAPALWTCSFGIGSGTASTGVRPATGVAASAIGGSLPAPVGNCFYLDITQATTGARPQMSYAGTTTVAQDMLPGRSYLCGFTLKIASNNHPATALSLLLIQLVIGLSNGDSYTVSPTTDGAPSETLTIAEDMLLHVRLPVVRIPTGLTVTSADLLAAATVQAAFSAGPVLTIEISEPIFDDVTGDEDLYI
jgi:hypothetical protein